jgi:hypothetical protein
MKKFLALYMAPAAAIQEMMKNTSKEDMQAGMNAWTIWMNENAKMFVDQGAPAGKTTRVTADGISSLEQRRDGLLYRTGRDTRRGS